MISECLQLEVYFMFHDLPPTFDNHEIAHFYWIKKKKDLQFKYLPIKTDHNIFWWFVILLSGIDRSSAPLHGKNKCCKSAPATLEKLTAP